MYLIQRCDVGFMIREFRGYSRYYQSDYRKPDVSCCEIRRAIYDKNAKPVSAYYWGAYKNQYMRWLKDSVCSAGGQWYNGRIYGKTLPALFRKELKKTGLQAYLKQNPVTDPERYLAFVHKVPQLEQMMKADLPVLVKECFHDSYSYSDFFHGTSESSLIKAMGIDGPRMKRLRESGQGLAFLHWLRYEKQNNLYLEDSIITWFCQNKARPETFSFLDGKMSMVQIYNYVSRQMRENQKDYRWVLETWKDTLSMAEKLKLDISTPYVFKPSDLHGRHQYYVNQIKKVGDLLLAEEFDKKFPGIKEIYASIRSIYAYEGDEYMILVPSGILDIIREGNALDHCVGKSERYLDRIQRRESYILFLRHTKKPKKSYYTLEVEPDGTVRQKRTLGDVQNEDILLASEFLREWQRVISKRLTATERELAQKSKVLRQAEFAEMKKNSPIIYTGALRGQRLLDVLLADLMENTEAADEPVMAAAA